MGTNPNLSQGEVLTPGQWNALLASKQDNLNFVPLNSAGGSMTGPLVTTASIAAAAGFNIPPGAAPSLPNPGDVWNVNGQLFIQGPGSTIGVNEYAGATVQIGRLSPAGTGGTGAMMGLGGTLTLTPLYSSRAFISIEGHVTNGTAGTGTLRLFSGTGAFPANGAALTGTQIGGTGPLLATISAAGATPFALSGIVSGLVPGTAYWFDLGLGSGAGTTFLLTESASIFEI